MVWKILFFFSVTLQTARKVIHMLMFGPEGEDGEVCFGGPFHLDFPLENGHQAFVNLDHIVLGQHLFDYGVSVETPPEGHYGTQVDSALAERKQWYHPRIALGIRGYGIMHLSGQSLHDMSMLWDAMVEGFPVSRFLYFIDDDGERNMVPYDRFIFAVSEPALLP